MKHVLIAATLIAISLTTPAIAADMGISVSIGQPGFYGRLDMGGYARPPVIYAQPMAIERVPMDRPPIYLRVPPNHARHWRRHCHEYNACGERVFFVEDNWYSREYAPRYQEQHRDHRDEHRDERRDEHRDDHRDNQRDMRRDDRHDNNRDR